MTAVMSSIEVEVEFPPIFMTPVPAMLVVMAVSVDHIAAATVPVASPAVKYQAATGSVVDDGIQHPAQ